MENDTDINLNLSEIVSATNFIKDFKSCSQKLIENENKKFFVFKNNEPCMVVITPKMYKLMRRRMDKCDELEQEKLRSITTFILNLMDKDYHYDFCKECDIIINIDENGTSCPKCKKNLLVNKCTIDFVASTIATTIERKVESIADLSVDTTYKDCIKLCYDAFLK